MHIAVCCYGLIQPTILGVVLNRGRRVCPIENTNGINLGIVIFASLCVIDGIIRHLNIEVICSCWCRIAIREHDDYTLAIVTSLNRMLGKNLICHVKPVLGIGIAICVKTVNGRTKSLLFRFCADQCILIITCVGVSVVYLILGRKQLCILVFFSTFRASKANNSNSVLNILTCRFFVYFTNKTSYS